MYVFEEIDALITKIIATVLALWQLTDAEGKFQMDPVCTKYAPTFSQTLRRGIWGLQGDVVRAELCNREKFPAEQLSQLRYPCRCRDPLTSLPR